MIDVNLVQISSMNPKSLSQFAVETVFSSPMILCFGISKIVWSSIVAASLPCPSGSSIISRYPKPGEFGSKAESYAYLSWLNSPHADRTEMLTNVPLSSIFDVDSAAISQLYQQIGFTDPREVAVAELRARELIGSKSVDLLIIDRVSKDLLLGLEIDSNYHEPPWQVDYDMIKSHFFLASGKRLLRIHCSTLSANMTWQQFSSLLTRADANWERFKVAPAPSTLQLHMPGGHQAKPWWEWTGY